MSNRFAINPGPLKLRGKVPKEDTDIGRCEALIDNPDEANLHNALAARWLVRFGA